MAFGEVGRRLVYTFVDNNNNSSTLTIRPATTLTDVELVTYGNAMAAELAGASNAKMAKYTLAKDFFDPLAGGAAAESEVERKLIIPFTTNIPNHGYVAEIPSPIFSLEIEGTDNVNPGAGAISGIIDGIINGLVGIANGAVTVAGVQIQAVGAPFVTHRNRSRR